VLHSRQNTNSGPVLPFVHDHSNDVPEAPAAAGQNSRQSAGKQLVNDLLKIRLKLDPKQSEYYEDLNELIDRIRAKSQLTDSQREERILYSVEKQQAGTRQEIAGDTKLPSSVVKTIVADLMDRGILYEVPRCVPGSGRQYYLIKSHRQNIPEANGSVFEKPKTVYDRFEEIVT
jgi:predicted transcriptional regulator